MATPIGNLQDITERARFVLNETDFIACEDTRIARKLCGHLAIDLAEKTLCSFNTLNENEISTSILESLKAGQNVALISDAGTPVVSDPGLPLLRDAYTEGINVVPVVGPSALTACISVCPMPMHDFRFIGFVERRTSAKARQLRSLLTLNVPVVFFDSPKRLLSTLGLLSDLGVGDRKLFIARELTKLHEEKLFDSVDRLRELLSQRERMLGEYVVVLGRSDEKSDADVAHMIDLFRQEDIAPSTAARLVAKLGGITRQAAYQLLTTPQRKDG